MDVSPLAESQPDFAFSLAAQLVCQGVTLTITVVLITHLVFTSRLHIELARTNFYLQLLSASILLVSVTTALALTLAIARTRSRVWPFMCATKARIELIVRFDYIAVAIPNEQWTHGQIVAYYFLQTFLALSCHATHVHFLTMLFPSALEAKLIFGMLGPLALTVAGLTFGDFAPTDTLITVFDAIQTVCNSTLTLLYTFGLILWGLVVNRSRTWRTDGGTASFGTLAITLALLGTAISYLEVKEENLQWLDTLVWAALLWNNWLSLWWFVSAGMHQGEVEDRRIEMERKRQRQIRRLERQRRQLGGAASRFNVLRKRRVSSKADDPGQSATSLLTEDIEMTDFARPAPSEASSQPSGFGDWLSARLPPAVRAWLGRWREAHDRAAESAAAASRPPPNLYVAGRPWREGESGRPRQVDAF